MRCELDEADIERIAHRIAQETLQTWNGGAGYGDGYFRSPAGLRVYQAALGVLRRVLAQQQPGSWTCIFCMTVNIEGDTCERCRAPR